ncbi:LexA family transcriptional regulator [Acinetobacter gandensis]|uniref:LexA family transcriptional regulator n=1 Tax=Acinetobacter gandensis TaxID=1443941 RepID=A0A1A7R6K3_9GAMM|nr:S24 family peptidase [Acinetobacter gandensis]KAB0628077.1 LexA family transcriptional regulator [Acinetobacter gandensis]OBX27501.1 LexA family transcriptional regulator [Acinetobacter gandensis]
MSKKLPIYFSDEAWSSLQQLMGSDGKPSPTINALLEQQSADQAFFNSSLNVQAIQKQSRLEIPVALERIPAGPAFANKDVFDKALDLNDLLVINPLATFIAHVDSESLLYAGFEINDTFLVDRSLKAKHGDIVVALIDNREITLKRLMVTEKMSKEEIANIFGDADKVLPDIWLKAENPAYEHIIPNDSESIVVQGVVTFNLKQLYKRSSHT